MSETSWSWADVPGREVPDQPRDRAERKELARKLRAQGEPIGVIAKLLRVGRNTVVSDLQKSEPPAPPEPKHPEYRSLGRHDRWTPQREHAVVRMLEDGVSIPEIAIALGVSTSSLRRRIGIIAPGWQGETAGAPIKAKEPDKTVEDRQALPAGSPTSWGALIRGTCLEGLEWPGVQAG